MRLDYQSSSNIILIYILMYSKSDDIEVAFQEVIRLDLDRILSRPTIVLCEEYKKDY